MAVHVRDSRLRSFVAFGNDVNEAWARKLISAHHLTKHKRLELRQSDELKQDQESHIRALSAPVCPQS
jgi:hypothetical protein